MPLQDKLTNSGRFKGLRIILSLAALLTVAAWAPAYGQSHILKAVNSAHCSGSACRQVTEPKKGNPSIFSERTDNTTLPVMASTGPYIQDTTVRYSGQRKRQVVRYRKHHNRLFAKKWATAQSTVFDPEQVNSDYIVHLAKAITYPTIAGDSTDSATARIYVNFQAYLRNAFPRVHAILKCEVVDKYSLLYTWKGTNPRLRPLLLLAHQDVVPIEPSTGAEWDHPPFSGQVTDSFIYGRGTIDDKMSVTGILESIETLLGMGYQPQHDIYIAFGHDEEVKGSGAKAMSELLASRGLSFEYVLDEGGSILDNVIPDVPGQVAFIGVAEKGYLTLELSVNDESLGGHSSAPQNEGAVGILGKSIYLLQDHPFKSRLILPVRQMFKVVGKKMSGIKGFVAQHPLFFAGLLKKQMRSNPLTSAFIQTTIAPTVIEAGVKDNVLPTKARMLVNFRIMPGETVNGVMKRVNRIIHDKRVMVKVMDDASNPTKATSIKSRSYKTLKKTIEQVYPSVLVAPVLNISTSDSRNYAGLTRNVLRFVPLCQKEADLHRFHGTNERISKEVYAKCIQFYFRFIVNSDNYL